VQRHLKAAEQEGRQLGRKYAYAVESYKNSFHGKVTGHGFKDAASCLDCHADADNYYLSVHNLKPSREPGSPVSDGNRLKTCKRCHTYADRNYASLDPHPTTDKKDSPFNYYAHMIYGWIGNVVLVLLMGLAAFETIGRKRDGVGWRLKYGSTWRGKSKRGRDRVE